MKSRSQCLDRNSMMKNNILEIFHVMTQKVNFNHQNLAFVKFLSNQQLILDPLK